MAQTAAQKAAAKKAAAKAAAKEATYIKSFENVTTPSSSNMYSAGERVNMSGATEVYNPAKAETTLTSTSTSTSDTSGGLTNDQRDAFSRLDNQLKQWGLGKLSGVITQLLSEGYSESTVMSMIKYDTSINPKTKQPYNADYNERFAGNTERIKQGLNALPELEYLAQEDSYEGTIKRYGLNTMLSLDSAANHKMFADYMAKGISAKEFDDRIQVAYDEVLNMDPNVVKNFKKFFPSITNQDLVQYFLAPDETIGKLKTKAAAAQIGAAANMQGLETDAESAMKYARQGKSFLQAQADYQNVAEVLPTGNKLSKIYAEEDIDYNQKVAEEEYLGQSAKAKLQRNRLASKERAMYSGQSGVDSGSLNKANNF